MFYKPILGVDFEFLCMDELIPVPTLPSIHLVLTSERPWGLDYFGP